MRRDHIGFAFQQFNLIPLLSVVENVEYPLVLKGGRTWVSGSGRSRVLAAVGITETHLTHKTRPNSRAGSSSRGGDRPGRSQTTPTSSSCDEPTGTWTQRPGPRSWISSPGMNREEGKTVVMVTHDPRMTEYADGQSGSWTGGCMTFFDLARRNVSRHCSGRSSRSRDRHRVIRSPRWHPRQPVSVSCSTTWSPDVGDTIVVSPAMSSGTNGVHRTGREPVDVQPVLNRVILASTYDTGNRGRNKEPAP